MLTTRIASAARLAAPMLAVAALVPALASPASAAGEPANDRFSAAQVLVGSDVFVEGDNIGATGQLGEPVHHFAASASPESVWYAWTAPETGPVTIDLAGSDFDTVLAVYRGTSVNRLTSVTSNDDSNGTLQSSVTFTAQRRVTYRIAVDSYLNGQGNIALSLQQ